MAEQKMRPRHNVIHVEGANEHNLKNISVDIPRDQLVVLTGLSGSGKSSLAFDTVYAEGQRRYMESLSSYARQFLGMMEKPDVERIDGLSPAISIDQKSTNRNPRSTVGTVTEIYDYFRLLYARIGIAHCPVCGREIKKQSVDQMVDQIMTLEEGTRIQLLAPVVRGKKGQHEKVLDKARRSGYVRAIIDGSQYELSEEINLDKNIKHSIDIIVDRLVIREDIQKRLTDSVETVLALADGLMTVDVVGGETLSFSASFSCPDCEVSIPEIETRCFSFNNPFGACPVCAGLGYKMEFSRALIIPDETKTLNEGAIVINGFKSMGDPKSWMHAIMVSLMEKYHFDMDTPFCDYPKEIQDLIWYGNGGERFIIRYQSQRGFGEYEVTFEGVLELCKIRYRETFSESAKAEYENYMNITPCEACGGMRLKREFLAVTVGGLNIYEITNLSVSELMKFMDNMNLTEQQLFIGNQILKQINARVKFLSDVGLSYLTLSRATASLSGGEAQRIRLATQIGSGLVGVTYILDEPSIGLHQKDNSMLLNTLKHLRDLGNTVLVVEHDEETMREADHIIDIGPGAGVNGGELVAQGTSKDIAKVKRSITGQYLSGKMSIPVPDSRRQPAGWLTVRGAKENNLKNVDASFPLGVLTCVTGVSGSGKSSLTNEILNKYLSKVLNRAHTIPGAFDRIEGVEKLDKIIDIDQSPIGRTPRSNPATYTGVFDQIRDLFAQTREAKERGYKKGRFSFNIKGGRCEACQGDGIIKIEMHFLPDVYVPCEVCGGKRYNRETLECLYKGKSIYDVLDMSVDEAVDYFENVPSIRDKIKTLQEVGLGYIKLGQPSTQLSGGEAQRVKLATELSRRSTGKTIYIMDEPTTGLHFADVHKLIEILNRLVQGGNTVIVIEHNLDVIKTADYIIDMGPNGGSDGGTVIAKGTPEEVALVENSYTGQYLKKILAEKQND
ncbi:MAG: excinuclease ABC subunit UvrA [Lachnospiraceae bacterium]|nr:excinuclease ABC subunit UvrA [Lachnospiraceae bacterium]